MKKLLALPFLACLMLSGAANATLVHVDFSGQFDAQNGDTVDLSYFTLLNDVVNVRFWSEQDFAVYTGGGTYVGGGSSGSDFVPGGTTTAGDYVVAIGSGPIPAGDGIPAGGSDDSGGAQGAVASVNDDPSSDHEASGENYNVHFEFGDQQSGSEDDFRQGRPVPEPASTLLIGLGLLGLAFRRKA